MPRRLFTLAVTGAGSAVGGAFVVSNYVLYPSWMWRRDHTMRELPSISPNRKSGLFMDKFTDPSVDCERDYHVVQFKDGEDRGWYIPNPNANSEMCLVAVHGAGNDRRELLKIVSDLQDTHHCNMLLFDCSNHGKHSGGGGISMGVREHEDVLEACAMAKEFGNNEIVLLGTSQGAASSVLAAAKKPEGLKGLVLENPFACGQEIVTRGLYTAFGRSSTDDEHINRGVQKAKQNPLVGALYSVREYIPEGYLQFIADVAFFRMGLEKTHAPIENIKDVDVPVFLMHGTDDHFVPMEHSKRLSEHAGSKVGLCRSKIHEWYPKAGHSMLYNASPSEYINKVGNFLASI
eukprot:TRINITY_DN27208_c0_g1_i1.p1 TRINITY_DN27208_c0_g1~~TRINITY_DN27208_c0_g1_i1.p1  ORF type:complete len:347 (+),score=137.82 TRINITY_DN27208_c0_g1_i1:50-1090(+)